MLEAALVAGLCAEGADVVLVGVLPTPGVAYLARERGAPAAVISASHNPFERQRHQAVRARRPQDPRRRSKREVEHELRSLAVSQPEPGPEGFARRGRRASTGAHSTTTSPRSSTRSRAAARRAARRARLRERRRVPRPRPLRCVRSAPSVEVHQRRARRRRTSTPAAVRPHPQELQEAVLVARADAGLAFDGDADRVIAVDERGELVDGDQIMAIAAHRPARPRDAARRRGRRPP